MSFKLVKVKLAAPEEEKLVVPAPKEDEEVPDIPKEEQSGMMYHKCTNCDQPAVYFSEYLFVPGEGGPFSDPVRKRLNHVYCDNCKTFLEVGEDELTIEDGGEITEEEAQELSQIVITPEIKNNFLREIAK